MGQLTKLNGFVKKTYNVLEVNGETDSLNLPEGAEKNLQYVVGYLWNSIDVTVLMASQNLSWLRFTFLVHLEIVPSLLVAKKNPQIHIFLSLLIGFLILAKQRFCFQEKFAENGGSEQTCGL